MNILKTLRKPYLSLFIASTMLFYSCNGNELIQNNETDNLDLTEFVNTNLSNNSFDTKLNPVSYFKLADYSEYTQKVEGFTRNLNDFEPYSIQLDSENRILNLHTVPTSETHATLFIESEDGEINKMIELNIGEYNESTDEFELFWSDPNSANRTTDCTTGASTVMAVGAIIAFASYFGCGPPCAFIGGAVAAVGAVGYIACNIAAGNYE